MAKKKYKIKDLVLNFVSLVTEGANPESDVLLVRSTEEALESQELPVKMFDEIMRHSSASQIQRDKLWTEFKRTWEWADNPQSFLVDFSVSFGKILGDSNPTQHTEVCHTEAIVAEEQTKEPTEEVAREAPAEDASLALDAIAEIERVKEERISFEKKLAEAKAEQEELRRSLEDLRSQEIERGILAEAEEMGQVHGLESEEVVELVRMTRKNEEFKVLADKLVEANRALLAEVTKEVGVSVPAAVIEDEGDELDKAVRALRAADPTLSEARAIARVLQTNPTLYHRGN